MLQNLSSLLYSQLIIRFCFNFRGHSISGSNVKNDDQQGTLRAGENVSSHNSKNSSRHRRTQSGSGTEITSGLLNPNDLANSVTDQLTITSPGDSNSKPIGLRHRSLSDSRAQQKRADDNGRFD